MSDYNILHAARDAVTGQLKYVADEVQQARLALCEVCEFKRGPVCGKCGCVLKGKTRLAKASCPIKKWMPEAATQGPAVAATLQQPSAGPGSLAAQSSATPQSQGRYIILLSSQRGVAPNAHYAFWERNGCGVRIVTTKFVEDHPAALRGAVVAVVEDNAAAVFLERLAPENRPRAAIRLPGRRDTSILPTAAFTHRAEDLYRDGKPDWKAWEKLFGVETWYHNNGVPA